MPDCLNAAEVAKPEVTLPGVYKDMENRYYHELAGGYSSSDINGMADGFDVWRYKKDNPKESTEAMTLGSVTHLVLEATHKNDPDLIKFGIAVSPEFDLRKTIGKEAKAAFLIEHAGKYVVDQEDFDQARRMVDAVMGNPESAQWFQGGESEVSCFVKYPGTEILAKCRPDYLRVQDCLSINFKTTRDASPSGFVHAVKDGGFDWANAWYVDVLKEAFNKPHFDEIYVTVEKADKGPCRVGVYTIDDADLAFARSQYKQILDRIPECEKSGIWPPLPAGLQTMSLPNYCKKVYQL